MGAQSAGDAVAQTTARRGALRSSRLAELLEFSSSSFQRRSIPDLDRKPRSAGGAGARKHLGKGRSGVNRATIVRGGRRRKEDGKD